MAEGGDRKVCTGAVRISERKGVPTEKGRLYQLDLTKEKYDEIYLNLSALMSVIWKVVQSKSAPQVVHDEFVKWKELYSVFLAVESELQTLWTPKERDECMEEFVDHSKTLAGFKEEIERYFESGYTDSKHEGLHGADKVSQHSFGSSASKVKSVSVHGSSASKVSSISVRDRLELKRVEEEQKRVELLARKAALHSQQELDMAERMLNLQTQVEKFKLERQKAELALQTEVKVSEAKLHALESVLERPIGEEETACRSTIPSPDPQVSGIPLLTHNDCGTNVRAASTPYMQLGAANNPVQSILNPAARTYLPKPAIVNPPPPLQQQQQPVQPLPTISNGANDLTFAISSLADILANREDKLPSREPDTFKGNVLEYPEWISSIESQVESKYPKATDRLYYLGKYTSGEARMCIKSLLPLNTEEAYNKAKKLLADRYGNKLILANSYRDKIEKWPTMKTGDGKLLREFSDFLLQCDTAMSTLSHLKVLDDADEHQKIINKLPKHIQEKWMTYIDKWFYDEDNKQIREEYPPFFRLCQFIARQARIACNPLGARLNEPKGTDMKLTRNRARSFASQVNSVAPEPVNCVSQVNKPEQPVSCASQVKPEVTEQAKNSDTKKKPDESSKCALCKGQHRLETCQVFKAMTLPDRSEFVKKSGFCFACLKWGHRSRSCRYRMKCATCGHMHPTVLHDDSYQPTQAKDTKNTKQVSRVTLNTEIYSTQDDECSHSLIVPVLLHHEDNPNDNFIVYALLDDQSDACFISDSVLDKLDTQGEEMQIRLSTMLAEGTITSKRVSGLVIKGIETASIEIKLPKTYSRDAIPAKHSQIPKRNSVQQFNHLQIVVQQLPPYFPDVEIGLLIGLNCAQAIKPLECVPGDGNDPYAIRTALGWGVVGNMSQSYGNTNKTCQLIVSEERKCHFTLKTRVKEVSPVEVNKMFELDFSEHATEEKMSQEDARFLNIMNRSIHQKDDGHYEVPLPFKSDTVKLPNNRQLAMRRLQRLRTRLMKDPKYKDDYTTFMENIISKNYAESVPQDELSLSDGSVWYIPHHGVYHPKKPGKIRIVFDCSAEYEGEVLNRHLLQGPDLTNSLVGVLCRFRKERVAFTCDIESMFHQVGVNKEDRNYLRFLWWKDGQLDSIPVEYRMKVHLFGATSSPGCANFVLKHTAESHKDSYGEDAAKFIKRDFYVDDGITSTATREDAQNLIEKGKKLCARGGFNLHKFVTNDKEILHAVPSCEQVKDFEKISILQQDQTIERTLGVQWCTENDSLQFRVNLQDKPLTRRGILSTVSSIFDPLGLVSPTLLSGKRILQELCRDGHGWDDPVPEATRTEWEKWRNGILSLAELQVDRCYMPQEFGPVKTVELHHFSDACLYGYGQCTYLRLLDNEGTVNTTLVMGKSRVAPTKQITVPRLELTAATLSVKVSNFLSKELEYKEVTQYFYTDSKVVLGYIANESKRFHIFVANRVQKIRDYTSPKDWRYVNSDQNPADCASRGLTAQELKECRKWWKGPEFLSSNETLMPPTEHIDLSTDDPEVKKVSVYSTNTNIIQQVNVLDRLKYFSSWFKAKRAIAVILKYMRILKERVTRKHEGNPCPRPQGLKNHYLPAGVQEIQEASDHIIKMVQDQSFQEEMYVLKRKEPNSKNYVVSKKSPLWSLDPFVDEKNVLRVGGRIRRATLHQDIKHPLILPRHSHVTNLVINHFHEKSGHSGRGMTLNSIRQAGFWIIGARAAVTKLIKKCITCRKLRGSTCEQKMADLPEDRLEPAPPFAYSAVDYFGPFYIKEKRSELKRWGVLFTCLASRAIHIETSNSMTTDSFINAYRRFVCRRGPVRELRSDRGSNFIGGKNELDTALEEMDDMKISRELLKNNCDFVKFKMNVPHASHMGGVWERMIRTTRSTLSALLMKNAQQLDDELLRTLMTEVEAIVNSRPLTFIDTTAPDSLEPLSPSQILTLKSNIVLPPPGKFVSQDIYCRRRWRRVQYLANEFWTRWRTEFMSLQQERKKWTTLRRNLKVDDIVLIVDDSLPRNQWPLARVIHCYKGHDGAIRKVKVKVGDGSEYDRPVHKLVLILDHDQGIPDEEPSD